MSVSIRSLVKKWSAIRAQYDDPYAAVEEFISTKAKWWPYVVIVEQIESGWEEGFRGALALNLVKDYKPSEHALAAFVTLSGQWPSDTTAALNLLSLAHRSTPSFQDPLDKFVSQAALRCLWQGLSDPSPLVSEEAANILGGFAPHHFSAATSADISDIRGATDGVLAHLDDEDIVSLLRSRADNALASAKTTSALGDVDARLLMKELETGWAQMPRGDGLATLQNHVIALAWAVTSGKSVQVLRIEDTKENTENIFPGWSIIEPWLAVVRDFIGIEHALAFAPLGAAEGSLIVILRVDTDAENQDIISQQLLAAKHAPLTSVAAEALNNTLILRGLRIRVTHVEANLTSASLSVEPGSGVASAPIQARRLTTGEIPQANEWERLFALVDCVASGNPVTLQTIGVTTARQIQYYKKAARVVGLFSPTDDLTRTGWLVHVAIGKDRWKRACVAFETSPCGQAWIEWSNGQKLSDIRAGSAEKFLAARSELTGETIERRANTLEVWLKALSPYAG